MQRLVAREAEQQRADEALLRSCAPQDLIQVPLWPDRLAPQQDQRLQGTLTIPAGCYVRLARRVFARAVQVTSPLVMLLHMVLLILFHVLSVSLASKACAILVQLLHFQPFQEDKFCIDSTWHGSCHKSW